MAPTLEAIQDLKYVLSMVILDILAVLSVIFRFWAISIKGTKIRSHDIICIVSLVTLIGYSIALSIGTVDGGIGLHISDVSGLELPVGLKSFFVSQFFWDVSICAFRLAILLLYIEVFGASLWLCRAAWVCVIIVCLFYVGALTTTLRLCQPIAFNWDLTLDGTCGDEGVAELAAAAINMVLDVGIVALPLPVVWKLQMRTSRKIGITVTFGLGLGIAVINLMRIILVLNCNVAADVTYCTLNSAILTVAEMAVGIMVACVPRMGPVFRRRMEERSILGTSANALRNQAYGFGSDYRVKGSQGSGMARPIRLDDIETADCLDSVYSKQSCSQNRASGRQNLNSSLKLGAGRFAGQPEVYAEFSPQDISWSQTEGIVVARNFAITEVRNVGEAE